MKLFSIAVAVGLAVARVLTAQQPLELAMPSGTVLYFDYTTAQGCPVGWTEFTSGRGRYVVGLVSGGTAGDTSGTALTDLQNITHTHDTSHTHPMSHTHSVSTTTSVASIGVGITDGGAGAGDTIETHSISGNTAGPSNANTGAASVTTSGTASTTAPYVEYLMCTKS